MICNIDKFRKMFMIIRDIPKLSNYLSLSNWSNIFCNLFYLIRIKVMITIFIFVFI